MAKYRKRPVTVDAMRWTGYNTKELTAFFVRSPYKLVYENSVDPPRLLIQTLEGEMEAWPGDWIIKGVAGEYYPCRNDIFEKTYEPVAEEGGAK